MRSKVCVLPLCTCTRACPLCVTHGISQTSGGSYGKDAGVCWPAWEEVNHFSTKCCSSNLLPFLLSATCMEIANLTGKQRRICDISLPASQVSSTQTPCCLQPKEKGESFRIEKREQEFNRTLVFFIVF